jgi:hypothetical protein
LGGIWTAKIAGAERFKQFTDQWCRMIFKFYYPESSFNIRNYEVDFNVATRILLCWMLNSCKSIKVNIWIIYCQACKQKEINEEKNIIMFQLSWTCLYYVSQSCKQAGVQLAGDIDKLETTACELC